MIRAADPMNYKPVQDPVRFPWHGASEVRHYWLDVNAMSLPMQVREEGT